MSIGIVTAATSESDGRFGGDVAVSGRRDPGGVFFDVLTRERAALDAIAQRARDQAAFIDAACRVLGGIRPEHEKAQSRIVVSGIGKAGLIARKVAATLSSLGVSAAFIHPVEGLHGDLGFVRSHDSALLFSYSGQTPEVVRFGRAIRSFGCELVAITRARRSTLGELASVCIELGEISEACPYGLAPTSSTTAMLAVGDALALAVAAARGCTEEDFARNHPAGSLGLRFQPVSGAMRTGARLVCVPPEMPLQSVVHLVSEAKTGAAILQQADGQLLGILTDGDLRRALLLGGKVLDQEVRNVASIPCHSIAADETLADAMRIYQDTRIEELPVVDRGTRQVAGLLCLKDIALI